MNDIIIIYELMKKMQCQLVDGAEKIHEAARERADVELLDRYYEISDAVISLRDALEKLETKAYKIELEWLNKTKV